MKTPFLLLAALAFTAPALADSGDIPANFDQAILRESAADQGIEGKTPRKQKPGKKQNPAGIPKGFEKAILSESASDQGLTLNSAKKNTKEQAKNKMAPEDLIAKVIRHYELYGDEDGPTTEEECVTEYSSQVEISACREMLGLKKSVVSSRHVATKKTPAANASGDENKPSMDFKTD